MLKRLIYIHSAPRFEFTPSLLYRHSYTPIQKQANKKNSVKLNFAKKKKKKMKNEGKIKFL